MRGYPNRGRKSRVKMLLKWASRINHKDLNRWFPLPNKRLCKLFDGETANISGFRHPIKDHGKDFGKPTLYFKNLKKQPKKLPTFDVILAYLKKLQETITGFDNVGWILQKTKKQVLPNIGMISDQSQWLEKRWKHMTNITAITFKSELTIKNRLYFKK